MSFSGVKKPRKKIIAATEEFEIREVSAEELTQEVELDSDIKIGPSPLGNIDKVLLSQLLEMFNANFISFYKDHDFNGSYPATQWRPLSSFCDNWHDVTHEFVDEELEAHKKRLYDSALRLGNIMAQNSAPLNMDYYSVYPTNRLYTDEENKRFEREAQEINNLCHPFVEECERFIRYAKKRLSTS